MEYVLVKSRRLDTLFICVYRPPDTTNEEWSQASTNLLQDVKLAQAYGGYQRVILGGDLNFKDICWDQYGQMVLGTSSSKQIGDFSNLCNKLYLTNVVDKNTRGSNLLDLVMTSDRDWRLGYEVETNISYSDHNLVTIRLTVNLVEEICHTDNLEYPNEIPLYNWRGGSPVDWSKYEERCNLHNWCEETQGMSLEEKLAH